MKKVKGFALMIALVFGLILTGCSSKDEEGGYKYITADQLKTDIESSKEMVLLDVQPKEDFDKHHIKGAIPTYAYPAKTAEEKAKLDQFIDEQKDNKLPIVIICPGGGGGATNSWAYMKEKGLDVSRFLILEKGQNDWPHDDLLEK